MQAPDSASEGHRDAPANRPPHTSERHEFIFSPADFRKILIKRRFVILSFFLAAILLAAIITYFTTPVYEAISRIDINPGRSTDVGFSDILENKIGGDESNRLMTEVRILQSDSVMLAVIHSENLFVRQPFSRVFKKTPYVPGKPLTPLQSVTLLRILRANLQVMVVPNTDLVEIHYRDPDPVEASRIADAVVDRYLEVDLRSRYEGTLRISSWLSGQLGELKTQSADAQRRAAQYQRANNLIGMETEGGNLANDSLRMVNEQLIQAEADRIVKEARYRLAQTRNPELLVSVAITTTLSTLRSQQAHLMVDAAELRSKYGVDYPRVREVQKPAGQRVEPLITFLSIPVHKAAATSLFDGHPAFNPLSPLYLLRSRMIS